jgi:hypothetical protein
MPSLWVSWSGFYGRRWWIRSAGMLRLSLTASLRRPHRESRRLVWTPFGMPFVCIMRLNWNAGRPADDPPAVG